MTNPRSEPQNGVLEHLILESLRFPNDPTQLALAAEHDSLTEATNKGAYTCPTM